MDIDNDRPVRRRLPGPLNDLLAGVEHHRAGRLDRAEILYQRALRKAPNNPDALHLLGVIANDRGRPERAIQLLGRALRMLPHSADVHMNLGNALRAAGRLTDAAASYRRAIALKPDFAAAYCNLGLALVDQEMFAPAEESCRRAISLDSVLAPAHLNLAKALRGLCRPDEAEAAYRQALTLNPEDGEAWSELGTLLAASNAFDQAMLCHGRASEFRPDDALIHHALGTTLYRMHDAPAAVERFRRAVTLTPDFAVGWVSLGRALRALGQFGEAVRCFRRAIELNPRLADAHRNLVTTGQFAADQVEVDRLQKLLEAADLAPTERVTAGFALGKLFDDANRFDEAFVRFAEANSLFRELRALAGEQFHADRLRRGVDKLIETSTPQMLSQLTAWGTPSELPVFIVGMPRSGTSLVEQIAASHSLVYGAGELKEIGRIASALTGTSDDLSTLRTADTAAAKTLGEAHLQRLKRSGMPAARVIDKLPDNIFKLGIIATLFPGARVIFCNRDARDTCLSNYFQLFTDGNLFSYDLTDCGLRARATARLAAHWQRVLPLRMIEIGYERLVEDLEGESRRLIDFLGLDWEPACLDFHRTERLVATASTWQVRQPLYNRSVARWRHYQSHLAPLLAVLDQTYTELGPGLPIE
jgi:tetratricopeptide (TPR) repeat protein